MKYSEEIPALIKQIKERIVFDLTAAGDCVRCVFCIIITLILFADMIFSTAHKSKGLEFDSVRVTDDYTANFTLENDEGDGTRQNSEAMQ